MSRYGQKLFRSALSLKLTGMNYRLNVEVVNNLSQICINNISTTLVDTYKLVSKYKPTFLSYTRGKNTDWFTS